MTIKLHTALAKRHLRVIKSAPADMQKRMTEIAVSALFRAYEETDDIGAYIDHETLYYAQKEGKL